MLYYNSICENYDDFKSRYYRNDGVTKQLRMNLQFSIFYAKNNRRDMIPVPSNDELMHKVLLYIQAHSDGCKTINFKVNNICYWMFNATYESDHLECVRVDGKDGLRLIKDDRVWGVKYGKMLNTVNATIPEPRRVPQHILNYAAELFAYKWRAEHPIVAYELHIDDDFERIYTSDEDFGSCMRNVDQWSFYRDAVDASACYLTDKNDEVVARAVRFNDVRDVKTGETLRILERQYSVNSRGDLKQMLVDKLIEAGEIDGFKAVNAGCGDSRDFVSIEGSDWSDRQFEISCRLDSGDTLSYQDSFKWYDGSDYMANNYGGYGELCLNTTFSEYDGCEEYLEWCYGEYRWTFGSRSWVEYYCHWIDEKDAWCDDWVTIDDEYYAKDSDKICHSDHDKEYYLKADCTYCNEEDDWFMDEDVVTDINGDYRYCGNVNEITYGDNEGEYSDDTVEMKIDGCWETVWGDDDNLSYIMIGRYHHYVYTTEEGKVFVNANSSFDDDDMILAGFVKVEDEWYTEEAALELLEELEEC